MRVFKFRSLFPIYVELHSPHVIEYTPFLCIFSILSFLLLLISDPNVLEDLTTVSYPKVLNFCFKVSENFPWYGIINFGFNSGSDSGE